MTEGMATSLGTVRSEFLDVTLFWNATDLACKLEAFRQYYHHWRTHLSLSMDSPKSRPVQLLAEGAVIEYPKVGGLPHHYERRAA